MFLYFGRTQENCWKFVFRISCEDSKSIIFSTSFWWRLLWDFEINLDAILAILQNGTTNWTTSLFLFDFIASPYLFLLILCTYTRT